MAQKIEIVMFPEARLSELQADLDRKRIAFQESRRQLAAAIKHEANPVTFIKKHPKWLLGFTFSALAASKIRKRAGKPLREASLEPDSRAISRWISNLLTVGARMAVRNFLPMGAEALRLFLGRILS